MSNIYLIILFLSLHLIGSCGKKEVPQPPDTTNDFVRSPIDSIVGEYYGLNHVVSSWSSWSPDSTDTGSTDTTYPMTIEVLKQGADSIKIIHDGQVWVFHYTGSDLLYHIPGHRRYNRYYAFFPSSDSLHYTSVQYGGTPNVGSNFHHQEDYAAKKVN